jgi:transketolase
MSPYHESTSVLRALAIDGIEAAKSGHPGLPLGMADVATVLWQKFLCHDPADPQWFDRDRFVLSAGHGSMLLYSLLHLSGYDLPLDELKRFRQWGSKTPGHPEYGLTPGVETTTGPLGQGFCNAIGLAIAERLMRDTFGSDLCDHYTYAICSDGDIMEGVAQEAASLAGHLGLGRVVFLYDDNHITIDGSTKLSFTEDVGKRFEAYGWHVLEIDGHDTTAIEAAIHLGRAEQCRPTLIRCHTVIGRGSKNQGTEKTHGAPLGKEDTANVKIGLGLDPSVSFYAPDSVKQAFAPKNGPARHAAWQARVDAHPRRDEFLSWLRRDTASLADQIAWPTFDKPIATRKASLACLNAMTAAAPWIIGGSADLAGSNGTDIQKPAFTPMQFAGAQMFNYGVREHAMASINNGLSLHGGVWPFGATFLVFHDYHRPAVRLACLMEIPAVFVYTHDSIFLGEDGPTHQPIETLLAMRSIPHFRVMRPADAAETVEAWKFAMRHPRPTAIVLTRQNLPNLAQAATVYGVQRGAYTLVDSENPAIVLVSTGSEVWLCVEAAKRLAADGIAARVVSMPCREQFLAQDASYRASVLPAGVPRLSVEAGVTLGWEAIVGDSGGSIGIDHFGASAPDNVLAERFGFTPDNVYSRARALLGR